MNPYALPNINRFGRRGDEPSLLDKAVSGTAHGIGQNFLKALYPKGVGMPQYTQTLGFSLRPEEHEDRIEYVVTAPLDGNAKDKQAELLQHVAQDQATYLQQQGIDTRFGKIHYTNVVGNEITVHIVFPKGNAAHILGNRR